MSNILDLIKAAVSQVAAEDDSPLAKASLEDIEAGAGIPAWRDRTPEESRKRSERKRLNDLRSAARRRERTERQVEQTKARQDRIRNPHRLADVYKRVIGPARAVIIDTAQAKGNQIARHIGPFEVEDVVSDAIERVAIAFCGYNVEVDDMAAVAKDWRDRKSLPRDTHGLAKVMAQTINIQSKKAVSQWWRDNPTLDSIEKLSTLEYNSHGVDEVLSRACADGDLGIVGWRPAGPGQIDSALMQHILNGVLSERKLQDVADVIMGMEEGEDGELEHRLNTDGTFPWYRYSKQLWLACGLDEEVYKKIPRDKRAKAVQTAVRNRFVNVQRAMGKAVALLSEFDTDLNQMREHIVVELAPVAQAPEMDAAELMEALMELLA